MSETTEHEAEPAAEPVAAHTAGAEAARRAPADTVMAGIQDWLNAKMRNSPVSQNTAAWNYLNTQLPALRDAILKEIDR